MNSDRMNWRSWTLAAVLVLAAVSYTHGDVQVSGERMKWHRITLTIEGPETSEKAEPSPFLDYRLDVTFSHRRSGRSYLVPGFYAADGNAAVTSADSGSKWRVHFTPDAEGQWQFAISFRKGPGLCANVDAGGGESAGKADGAKGMFRISPTDKTAPDLRSKGRLRYVGEHYLRFAETGQWFLKCGADAPENLLAYADFDSTPNVKGRRKTWEPHFRDYSSDADDLLWGKCEDKGTGLLGPSTTWLPRG